MNSALIENFAPLKSKIINNTANENHSTILVLQKKNESKNEEWYWLANNCAPCFPFIESKEIIAIANKK